ncbi:TPA-induced transmembrane protein [Alosa sapidissima]|uniref:TPA-induced transmembrane protein n=1 Tax=Alosa sapidissima TaxID=34773 RepID=UPI001C090FB9|nr:TPA-induced transmembrane protein [Alosa sapidissima]
MSATLGNMGDSMELRPLENNNISAETVDKIQVASGNGGFLPNTPAAVSETSSLLDIEEDEGNNVDGASPVEDNSVRVAVPEVTKAQSAVRRVKKDLNNPVCGLKLWIVLIILLLVIVLVIILSIGLNIALYKDLDEKYDISSFVVPRIFDGNLSVNQTFSRNTTALHDLATQLQDKINAFYHSSDALARYFRHARIKTLRNGSVIVDFCLAFHMPLDSDQLQRYTLSQEMVSSVLRQHLYDQDTRGGGDPLYILPTSVRIQDGGSSCNS